MISKNQIQKIFYAIALIGLSPLASADSRDYLVDQPHRLSDAPYYETRTKVYIDGDGRIDRVERRLGSAGEPEGTDFYNEYGMKIPDYQLDSYISDDYGYDD